MSDDQRTGYREDGYAVLDSVIPEATLTKLDQSCRKVIARTDARDNSAPETDDDLDARQAYFEPAHPDQYESIAEFSSGPLCAAILRGTLGPTAYLMLAQYTIKTAASDLAFEWHQDAAYLPESSAGTVNLWCALDDMTEENGTLYIMPNSKIGLEEDQPGPENGRIAEALADEVGTPFVAPAGSIVIFASNVFHRSGPNTTRKMRRALTLEFSEHPLLDQQTMQPLMWAIPVLRSGATV